MVKRTSLYRKLASYSALATAVLAVKKSDAQIVYTALNPNVKLSNYGFSFFGADTSYYLDLNNDGNPDFKFTAGSYFSSSSCCTSSYRDARSTFISAGGIALNGVNRNVTDVYGNAIGSKNGWTQKQVLARHFTRAGGGHNSTFKSSGTTGNVINKDNVYLPLKLNNNGNTYYGWVRLSTFKYDTLFIKDYAYNSIPDSSIKAGDVGCTKTPITPLISISGDTLKSTNSKKYQWYSNGVALGGDTSDFITGTQGNSYSVLTMDANGCLSQSVQSYLDSCLSSKPVIYNITSVLGCNNPVELNTTSAHENCKVEWLFNGNIDSTDFKNDQGFSASRSGNYSTRFIDTIKGCTEVSNTITIKIDSFKILSPVYYQVCDTLFTSPSSYHIQWYDSSFVPLDDTIYRFLPPSSQSVYYVAYSEGNCLSYDQIMYVPFEGVLQTITSVSYNNIFCAGSYNQLYYNSSLNIITDSLTSYQWQFNGVNITGANQSYYNADSTGSYSLVIHSGKCVAFSNDLLIVMDTTHPTIMQSDDTLFAENFNYFNPVYQWFFNNDSIQGATMEYNLPLKNGIYSVATYDTNYCWVESYPYYYSASGISSVNQQNDISIYNYDKLLRVNLSGNRLLGSEIKIYNVEGQEVFSDILTSDQTVMNLENLEAGLYIVRVTGQNSVINKKIVIE